MEAGSSGRGGKTADSQLLSFTSNRYVAAKGNLPERKCSVCNVWTNGLIADAAKPDYHRLEGTLPSILKLVLLVRLLAMIICICLGTILVLMFWRMRNVIQNDSSSHRDSILHFNTDYLTAHHIKL